MLPYLFSSYDKNKFHKKLQNCKGGTILKWLVAKPLSRGQALGGVQGAEPREAPRLRTKNQHFEPPPFSFSEDFLLKCSFFFFFFFLPSVMFFWERRSRGFRSPNADNHNYMCHTKYQIYTKLPQIPHIHINRILKVNLQLFRPTASSL